MDQTGQNSGEGGDVDYGVYSDGHLKSAIQKFVRRGMSDEAVATAIVLSRRGLPLFRRLPIIAAEDVGWEYVMPTFTTCRELASQVALSGELSGPGLKTLAKLVRVLALSEKDRDCGGLAGLATNLNRREFIEPCRRKLREAIEGDQAMLAMRHCERFAANRLRRWVWDLFRLIGRARGGSVERHIEAIRGESYVGVLTGDELILMAAAIFALTGSKNERSLNMEEVDGTLTEPRTWLPWYAFDMHTREGVRAMGELEKNGADVAWLSNAWWYWESALTKDEIGILTQLERAEGALGDMAEWGHWRDRVRQSVEGVLNERGIPYLKADSLGAGPAQSNVWL